MYKNCDEHPDVVKMLRYGGADKIFIKNPYRRYLTKMQCFWDENLIYLSEEEFYKLYQKRCKKENEQGDF